MGAHAVGIGRVERATACLGLAQSPITVAPSPRLHPWVSPVGRPEWEEGYYRVKKLVAHRLKYNGTKEYLVQWQGKNPKTGQLWADTWCVADDLTPDLVEAYEARLGAVLGRSVLMFNLSHSTPRVDHGGSAACAQSWQWYNS